MSYNQAMDTIKKVKDLRKLVESMGYQFARQTGSHMIYKADNKPSLVIPANKEIPRGTLRNVLKLAYGIA